MKIKKFFEKLIDAITTPFISVYVAIETSKELNEDGSWDEYHRRRNERAQRKEMKKAAKERN
jgi:hypothetical protein